MESNRRRYPDDDNWDNMAENQRIGRDIARERGNQPPQDQYRSGQSYHNRNEGYGPDQTHYGSRPDSAYRNQNAINYGNRPNQNQNNHDRNNQRFNQNDQRNNQNDQRFNQNDQRFDRYNQQNNGFSNQNRNPNTNYHEQSSGERHYDRERDTWPERNEYKDDDYRYRSGNRGNWHAPEGFGHPDNNRDRNQHNYRDQQDYRNLDRDRDQGFFGRIGDSISNTWNNLTNPDEYHPTNQRRNYNEDNRNNRRGYESGPRWADESEHDRRERERGDFRSDLH